MNTIAEGMGDVRSDWEIIREMMDNDDALELAVSGFNRGGLLVEWHSLRGFVPASQLMEFPSVPNPQMRQRALATRVGDTLILRVIELNQEQNRLIFSERAAQVTPPDDAPNEEMADAIVFLCSDASRYIIGQTIELNGGMFMV
jgi:ribosomal protein S1